MIDFKNIHAILSNNKAIGVSENIDIAKGLHAIPKSFKEMIIHIKRQWARRQ
jgi:uncharacterized protein (UPF0128 family)